MRSCCGLGRRGYIQGCWLFYILTERFYTFNSKHIMDIGVITVWFARSILILCMQYVSFSFITIDNSSILAGDVGAIGYSSSLLALVLLINISLFLGP